MKIKSSILIIGAGYSGLILQDNLKKEGINNSIIIERGYRHGYSGDDYVIFTKNKFDFTENEIDVHVSKISSGSKSFDSEYSEKVYNKKTSVQLFSGGEHEESTKGYAISSEKLLNDANIYGNIEISNIDIHAKIAYGYVLHINKKVECHYDVLVSTIPIHEFAKLISLDVFESFNLFISYYPIGIKKKISPQKYYAMEIQYLSDPDIPYYRRQFYGNSIYYEYCLNKPYSDRFHTIIVPGKFSKPKPEPLMASYKYFEKNNVFLLGRYAMWHPDFLLDHIITHESIDSVFSHHINNMYKRIKSL